MLYGTTIAVAGETVLERHLQHLLFRHSLDLLLFLRLGFAFRDRVAGGDVEAIAVEEFVELHEEFGGFGRRWTGPDFYLFAGSWVDDGDVGIGGLAVAVLEVVLHVLTSSGVVLGILHKEEVFLDCVFYSRVLPDISVQDLTVEDCRVLNVD